MVKLRLQRRGRKKLSIYKIVAADSRSPRDGKFIEAIGEYNPLTQPASINIKEDRAMYWLNVGAQPTDTVRNLLSKNGIMLQVHLKRKGADETTIATELSKWKDAQAQRQSRLVNKKQVRSQRKKSAEKTETTPTPSE